MKKDIWQEFSEKLIREKERRPKGDGWLTIGDVMKRFNKTRAAASKFIAKNERSLERFRGVVASPKGKLVCCIWYRPKP